MDESPLLIYLFEFNLISGVKVYLTSLKGTVVIRLSTTAFVFRQVRVIQIRCWGPNSLN